MMLPKGGEKCVDIAAINLSDWKTHEALLERKLSKI